MKLRLFVANAIAIFVGLPPAEAELIPVTKENQILGIGISSDGGIRNQAVKVGNKSTWVLDSHPVTTIKLDFIEDSKAAMGLSASASYKAGFGKVSTKVDYLQNSACNEYSTYGLLHCKTERGLLHLPLPTELTPENLLLAQSNHKEFQAKFGDGYVYGLNQCAEYFGLVEIKSSSLAEKNNLDAQLKAQIGFFKADGTLKKQFESVVSHRRVSVQSINIGGPASIPVARNLDELQKIPELWKTEVQARAVTVDDFPNGQNQNVSHATSALTNVPWGNTDVSVMDYSTVIGLAGDAELKRAQEHAIEELAKRINEYEALKKNLLYIKQNKGQFAPISDSSINSMIDTLDEEISLLLAEADGWLLRPHGKIYQARPRITVTLPRRNQVTYKVIKAQVPVGKNVWTEGNTHIQLKSGQQVSIFATDSDYKWSEGAGNPMRNADGIAADGSSYKAADTWLQNANVGELIGRVGEDIFRVGGSSVHTCADSGELCLTLNEGGIQPGQDGNRDNIGRMNVGIVPYTLEEVESSDSLSN